MSTVLHSEPSKKNTCLFTGHRNIAMDESLEEQVKDTVRSAYAAGYRHFISGGAMGFDLLAAVAVINLRARELPDITLTLALPHFAHHRKWPKRCITVFANVLGSADQVVYVSTDYVPGCMHKRNRYMVSRSSLCIAYCGKDKGGTAYTIRCAENEGAQVINLFPKNP